MQAPVQQVIVAAPPPVFVQAPPQQVIVQQSQPEVIFQQAAHCAGADLYRQSGSVLFRSGNDRLSAVAVLCRSAGASVSVCVGGGYYKPRYYGRPYHRVWRDGYRPYRHYGVYRAHRHAVYHRRHMAAPHVYKGHVGPKKYWN